MKLKGLADDEFAFKPERVSWAQVFGLLFLVGVGIVLYFFLVSFDGGFSAWQILLIIVVSVALIPIKYDYERKVRKSNYINYLRGFSIDDLKFAITSASDLDEQSRFIIIMYVEEVSRQ